MRAVRSLRKSQEVGEEDVVEIEVIGEIIGVVEEVVGSKNLNSKIMLKPSNQSSSKTRMERLIPPMRRVSLGPQILGLMNKGMLDKVRLR